MYMNAMGEWFYCDTDHRSVSNVTAMRALTDIAFNNNNGEFVSLTVRLGGEVGATVWLQPCSNTRGLPAPGAHYLRVDNGIRPAGGAR